MNRSAASGRLPKAAGCLFLTHRGKSTRSCSLDCTCNAVRVILFLASSTRSPSKHNPTTNHDIHGKTACGVSRVETQSSVPRDVTRSSDPSSARKTQINISWPTHQLSSAMLGKSFQPRITRISTNQIATFSFVQIREIRGPNINSRRLVSSVLRKLMRPNVERWRHATECPGGLLISLVRADATTSNAGAT